MKTEQTISIEEIWEQFHKSRDEHFRNLLMEHYRHLVRYCAERLHSKLPDKVELDDLISAGIFGLMKGAARELGEYNIKVNAVTPGMILHDNIDLGGYSADGYIAETMLGRTSNTRDFASFILFLSQKNNISGQTFNLDSRLLF